MQYRTRGRTGGQVSMLVLGAMNFGRVGNTSQDHQGGSRRWLFGALDDSLRRLGVGHVDLYQIHRWDPRTSDEETLSALTDRQRTGKVRYFGSPTLPAYRIRLSSPPTAP